MLISNVFCVLPFKCYNDLVKRLFVQVKCHIEKARLDSHIPLNDKMHNSSKLPTAESGVQDIQPPKNVNK